MTTQKEKESGNEVIPYDSPISHFVLFVFVLSAAWLDLRTL